MLHTIPEKTESATRDECSSGSQTRDSRFTTRNVNERPLWVESGHWRSNGAMSPFMANGGWYGTPEEWQRLQGPLLAIDPVLDRFAAARGVRVSRNAKDAPERSLTWGGRPRFLIQLYLESDAGPTWNMWLCCSEDRGDSRYWRTDFAVRGQPLEAFQARLSALLEESFETVKTWGNDPDQLQFATKLTPIPRS